MNKLSRVVLNAAMLSASLVACAGSPTGPAASAASATSASAPVSNAKSMLIVVTNIDKYPTSDRRTGYWVAEVAQPAKVFADAGLRFDFASPKGGATTADPDSDPRNPKGHGGGDAVSLAFLADATMQKRLGETLKLRDVNLGAYDAIFFAGGTGAAFDFAHDADVQQAARTLYEGGKVVASVCHGTAALVDVKLSNGSFLVAGKNVTGFSNREEDMAGNIKGTLPLSIEDELRSRGATYSAGAPWQSNAVRDGKLITGQQPQSARAMAEQLVAALEK